MRARRPAHRQYRVQRGSWPPLDDAPEPPLPRHSPPGRRRRAPALSRELLDLGKTRAACVLGGELGSDAGGERPADAQSRIIPGQGALMLGAVEVRALVEKIG